MFSFLDMVNHSLGYFNIKPVLKNKLYTIIAFLGDCYLIYVTWRLLANHVWMRGILYCLAVVLISYYLYLNFVYYFLGQTSRFDVLSPWLVKVTGYEGELKQPERSRQAGAPMQNQSNGYFGNDEVMPAEVTVDAQEQENLRRLVDSLVEKGIFLAEYDGKDAKQIIDEYNETGKPVNALNSNQTPPYFDLEVDGFRHRFNIFAGVNQMQRMPVGHIDRIGLTDVHEAANKYHLYLANLFVTGGPRKIPGRHGNTILTDGDFGLQAQVAYRQRNFGEESRRGRHAR